MHDVKKRGALHQPLTENVGGGCCENDQGAFCCLTLEGPCPFACEYPQR